MPQATRTHKQEIKGNNKLEFEFSSKLELSKEPSTIFKTINQGQKKLVNCLFTTEPTFYLTFLNFFSFYFAISSSILINKVFSCCVDSFVNSRKHKATSADLFQTS